MRGGATAPKCRRGGESVCEGRGEGGRQCLSAEAMRGEGRAPEVRGHERGGDSA